jgi:hypothetical protein
MGFGPLQGPSSSASARLCQAGGVRRVPCPKARCSTKPCSPRNRVARPLGGQPTSLLGFTRRPRPKPEPEATPGSRSRPRRAPFQRCCEAPVTRPPEGGRCPKKSVRNLKSWVAGPRCRRPSSRCPRAATFQPVAPWGSPPTLHGVFDVKDRSEEQSSSVVFLEAVSHQFQLGKLLSNPTDLAHLHISTGRLIYNHLQ